MLSVCMWEPLVPPSLGPGVERVWPPWCPGGRPIFCLQLLPPALFTVAPPSVFFLTKRQCWGGATVNKNVGIFGPSCSPHFCLQYRLCWHLGVSQVASLVRPSAASMGPTVHWDLLGRPEGDTEVEMTKTTRPATGPVRKKKNT